MKLLGSLRSMGSSPSHWQYSQNLSRARYLHPTGHSLGSLERLLHPFLYLYLPANTRITLFEPLCSIRTTREHTRGTLGKHSHTSTSGNRASNTTLQQRLHTCKDRVDFHLTPVIGRKHLRSSVLFGSGVLGGAVSQSILSHSAV